MRLDGSGSAVAAGCGMEVSVAQLWNDLDFKAYSMAPLGIQIDGFPNAIDPYYYLF